MDLATELVKFATAILGLLSALLAFWPKHGVMPASARRKATGNLVTFFAS